MIFSFSSQTGTSSAALSYQVSFKLVETKSMILKQDMTPQELRIATEIYHPYVRKLAHMTEYFLLALSLFLPLSLYHLHGRHLFFLVLILSIIFAGLDEYHQSFVSERGPSIIDVGIDSFGALIGCYLSQFTISIQKHISKKRKGGS